VGCKVGLQCKERCVAAGIDEGMWRIQWCQGCIPIDQQMRDSREAGTAGHGRDGPDLSSGCSSGQLMAQGARWRGDTAVQEKESCMSRTIKRVCCFCRAERLCRLSCYVSESAAGVSNVSCREAF
jgi:hypothetical protein